jgi:hypothetical protein
VERSQHLPGPATLTPFFCTKRGGFVHDGQPSCTSSAGGLRAHGLSVGRKKPRRSGAGNNIPLGNNGGASMSSWRRVPNRTERRAATEVEWLRALARLQDPSLTPEFAYASAICWVRALAMLTHQANDDPEAYLRAFVERHLNDVGPLYTATATPDKRLASCCTSLYMAANYANALDLAGESASRGD